jgi:hypothetical protein
MYDLIVYITLSNLKTPMYTHVNHKLPSFLLHQGSKEVQEIILQPKRVKNTRRRNERKR